MIRLEGLTKAFGGRTALHPLTLEVPEGQVFGLLGHNGAGKSTTFGTDPGPIAPERAARRSCGASPCSASADGLSSGSGRFFETPAFYDYLSGWRNLCMLTALSGHVPRAEIEETVRYVGLEERIHSLVRVYSHGMRQRLGAGAGAAPPPRLGAARRARRGPGPGGHPGDARVDPAAQPGARDDGCPVLAPARGSRANLRPHRHPATGDGWCSRDIGASCPTASPATASTWTTGRAPPQVVARAGGGTEAEKNG